MGVGAVFISTLAIHRLPSPQNPPVTQQDYLSLALEPIVSFIVFSSIIIRQYTNKLQILLLIISADGLSIPFFNLGRNISRNATLTRTLTNPLRTPDWLLGTNRTATGPQVEASDAHYIENTLSSQRDVQSKQSDNQVSAITIDIREPSAAPEKDTEADRKVATQKFAQPISALAMPSHEDTTPDSTNQPPDALEINMLLGQQSSTNPSKRVIEGEEVAPSNRPKVVQFSTG